MLTPFKSLLRFIFPQRQHLMAEPANEVFAPPTLGAPTLENTTESLTTNSTFDSLPNEMMVEIFKEVPPSLFVGDNPLNRVSKGFDVISSDVTRRNKLKKSVPELLDSCKDEHDALFILNNESIRKQLRFDEILQIAGFVPKIVQNLLRQRDLSKSNLINLGLLSETAAKKILSLPDNVEKIGSDGLLEISKKNKLTAMHIVKNITLAPNLLCKIGKYHQSVALHIWNTPALSNELDGVNLARLGYRHEYIAWDILNTRKLNGAALAKLGQEHRSIAKHILTTPTLNKELDSKELYRFGKHLEDDNTSVFSAKKIYERYEAQYAEKNFYKSHLFMWVLKGHRHKQLCKHILNTPELYEQIRDTCIGLISETHPELVIDILNIPVLSDILVPHFFFSKMRNQIGAEHIIKTESLYNLLENWQIVKLGQKYPSVRIHILKTPEILDKLSEDEISELDKASLKLSQIIERPALLKKVYKDDLFYFGTYPILAEYILNKRLLVHNDEEIQENLFVYNSIMNIIDPQEVRPERRTRKWLCCG